MARRRRRRIGRNRSVAHRIASNLARVLLVVLVAVAVGCAFYAVLSWVAAEGARRGSGGG